jgi:hypothetical protein
MKIGCASNPDPIHDESRRYLILRGDFLNRRAFVQIVKEGSPRHDSSSSDPVGLALLITRVPRPALLYEEWIAAVRENANGPEIPRPFAENR